MSEIKLTEKEKATIPHYKEKWRAIGLNCEPCRYEEAKSAATRCYEAAGYKPPLHFHHTRSPIECRDLALELKRSPKYRYKYGKSTKEDCIREQVYGSHDGNWFAYYDLLWEQRQDKRVEKMLPLFDLAKVCGWWAPYDENCILQDRHEEIHFNDRDQLHNEEGPAIAWRDGVKLWVINNVDVDEQIVMKPETQTLKQITGEKNVEVKRLRITRYGWPKYLAGVGAKKIHGRVNPVEYTKESLYKGDGLECNILVCVCPSTTKVFALEVPPTIESCENAQRYLSSGMSDRILVAS
jgi:hypothetical protein